MFAERAKFQNDAEPEHCLEVVPNPALKDDSKETAEKPIEKDGDKKNSLHQPGIIFSSLKTKLSSEELLKRME